MADNDTKLSLENAKWFAEQLGNFSPKDQATLIRTGDFGIFEKILTDHGVFNSLGMWQGRIDFNTQRAQGVEIAVANSKNEKQGAGGQKSTGGAVGTAAATAGLMLARKGGSYEEVKKSANEYAENAVKIWNDQEKKYQKKPPQKIDSSRSASARDAYERAERDYHDMIAVDVNQARAWAKKNPNDTALAQALDRKELERKDLTYKEFDKIRTRYKTRASRDHETKPLAGREMEIDRLQNNAHAEIHDRLVSHSAGNARKWAREYNDPALAAAIERKKQQDERLAIENQGRISKALGKNPSTKLAPPVPSQSPATTETSSTPWTPLPQNTPATAQPLAPQQVHIEQGRIDRLFGRAAHAPPGAYNTSGAKLRSINKSGLGKVKPGLNDASSYMQRLFGRSLIGSAINAITGAITTTVSAVAGFTTTLLGALSAAAAAIVSGLSFVSLPLAVVMTIIIILLIGLFAILFGDPTAGGTPPESPYPGITYSKVCPQGPIPKNGHATCQLTLLYNPLEAQCLLSDITLVDTIPNGTSVVEDPRLTTGNYTLVASPLSVQWKLSENISSSGISQNFSFNVTITSSQDITVNNTVHLDGCTQD